MSHRRLAVVGMMIVVAAAWSVPGWCQPLRPRARILSTSGTVKVQRAGNKNWARISRPADHSLYGGDHVRTSQRAWARIAIDGARITLSPMTHVIIPARAGAQAPRGVSGVWAVFGRVFVWLVGTRRGTIGSEGAVAAASGTKFLFEVSEDGTTRVTVLEGEVRFFNDLGEVLVARNEQSTAAPGVAPSRPMQVDPSGYIEWEASVEALQLGWELRFLEAETRERLAQLADAAMAAAAAAPDDVRIQIAAGDVLHDIGDLLGAEAAYRRALALEESNPLAHLRLGFALLAQVRPQEAEAEFAAAAKLSPDSSDALIGQAAALTHLGTAEGIAGAKETLAKAMAMKPDNALAHVLSGVIAMREGDAGAARTAFERAISLDARAYQAHAQLAIVELAEGRVEAALQKARQAAELAPTSALAHESLATVHFFVGEFAAAREQVQTALEINPQSATGHLLLSDICVAEGDLASGLAEAQLAVTLDPQLGPAYSALGMIFLAYNDLPGAEKAFARALELMPKLVSARTGMGVTYARQGNLAQAMAMQKATIALDSSSASVHNNKGAVHLALGEFDDAVAEFEAALKINPDWSTAHANLAMVYLEQNRFAEAVREGERAVALGERSARAYTNLARVYIAQGRTNKAAAALREAIELDEGYALAHLEMAEVQMREGRSRDALRHQFQALVADPSAMVENRQYSQTEASVTVGSLAADIKTDGRESRGAGSYYVAAAHEKDDWDRQHSDWEWSSILGIVGRQQATFQTEALYFSWDRFQQDRPGMLLPSGLPEDADYESDFRNVEVRYFARTPLSRATDLTLKLGYSPSWHADYNPDSLLPDPKPFRSLKLLQKGPLAEMRLDKRSGLDTTWTGGVALFDEDREVSGELGSLNPVRWTHIRDTEDTPAATCYLQRKSRLGEKTKLRLGGRMATRKGMSPVLRPEASLQHEVSKDGTIVLLTRPVMRDDVSELSPVYDWALRDWLSPLDLGAGGFSQSYELQYELTPSAGSLLRLSAFYRDLKTFFVDLEDPAWSAGTVGIVLASGTMKGGEIEWERRLGRNLSAGIWLRYTDTENDDMRGMEMPYQPKLTGQLRLDYLDRSGWRLGAEWVHIGKRYADLANLVRLDSYDVVNLQAAKQINIHTKVFIGVDNVFDKDYGFWQIYPGRGRTVRGGVEHRF